MPRGAAQGRVAEEASADPFWKHHPNLETQELPWEPRSAQRESRELLRGSSTFLLDGVLRTHTHTHGHTEPGENRFSLISFSPPRTHAPATVSLHHVPTPVPCQRESIAN